MHNLECNEFVLVEQKLSKSPVPFPCQRNVCAAHTVLIGFIRHAIQFQIEWEILHACIIHREEITSTRAVLGNGKGLFS